MNITKTWRPAQVANPFPNISSHIASFRPRRKVGNERAHFRNATTLANAGQRISWLKLTPRTGRTHQLRAHCNALGTPIVGDGKYGGKASYVEGLPKTLHLPARSITFFHPITGKRVEIFAPLINQCSESWKILDFDETID